MGEALEEGQESPEATMTKFHLLRAAIWPLLGVYILVFNPSLAQSVGLVIVLSLYANFASDISAAQGARAKKEAEKSE